MSINKVNITIDGTAHTVDSKKMLIEITDELGIYIPRFCYHEKLSIAANCRMCLVEVENSNNALPACATPVSEGMVVNTQSTSSKTAQESTMEFLLINHPLDCPICDQGGECELQDLAYSYGKNNSRFDLLKQTKPNDDLGPLVSTDMTRCIMCTRCVRFGSEVAGIQELGTIGRGEASTISTFVEQTVDHELSGNIIDLCPVGALNNKPYRYTDRTWELDQIKSISPHDCVGSNIYMHVKNNKIKRVVPLQNDSINESWIADRDRFGFDGIYSEDRIEVPMIRSGDQLFESSMDDAIKLLNENISSIVGTNLQANISALISPSTSLVEQFLLANYLSQQNIRNFDHRINQIDFTGDPLDPLFPHLNININDIQNMKTILIVGSDIRKETPILAHWVKKAADSGSSIHFIDTSMREYHFPISDYIMTDEDSLTENVGLLVKAAFNITNSLIPIHIEERLNDLSEPTTTHKQIALSLFNNDDSLIIHGLLSRSHPDFALIRSYINILSDLTKSKMGELSHGSNSVGAYITGCIPHRNHLGQPSEQGLNALQIASSNHDLLILYGLETSDCIYEERLNQALKGSKTVVAFTYFQDDIFNEYADIIIPIKTSYESKGSFINLTGTYQEFNNELSHPNNYYSNEKLLSYLIEINGKKVPSFDQFLKELKPFIFDCISNQNFINELPLSITDADNSNSLKRFNMYNVDSILRRSKPLQLTKEVLSDN